MATAQTRMIGKTISHYRILGQVGEGGMGVVYVAEDLHLGRRVAIKIPHAGRDESHYRARFLREARSVSKLRHPNIAAVHDYGETDDGQPFIVMELVSGETLGDVLAKTGLSIARSVEVARQTAEALSEAHRRGVVHRDIKPSNVVIDDGGEVKVLDFGLAKQLHEDGAGAGGGPDARTLLSARTRSDVVIGTPLYLSPEQARGSKVDGRSDLFALGALLYECLTGRPAFSGSNVIEIGAQVLHFDPPPPSRLNPRVPAELDKLTLKALSKKPEDRFQSAAEFAAELARVGSRLPDSDTATTRRLSGADTNHRSSALITMAEGLRRPKFSPLTLLASLAGLALVIWAVWYLRQPSAHEPTAPVAALYQQGVEAMREGSYYRASVLLSQAVQKDSEFALAHARLAEALLELDFIDRAKDEMLAVNRLVTDFSVYPRADALYLEAVRSTMGKDNAAAVRGYEEIVRLAPKHAPAHLDLGRAYERDLLTEKALASYTEAIRLDPSYAAAFLRLGAMHARLGNQAGASDAFEHAESLYADQVNTEGQAAAHYQLGRFLLNTQQKPAAARPEFEKALALAQATNNTYQQVQSLLQLALTLDDGAAAQKTAEGAVSLANASGMNDQVANGHLTVGNILFGKLGKHDEALAAFEQALQFARSYKLRRYEALALFGKGSLLYDIDRLDEAEPFATQARDFFVQGGYRREAEQVAMLLARIRKQRGDYAGALGIFEELLRSAERAGDVGQAGALHHECGGVLQSQEKYAQALDHYQESARAARTIDNQGLLTYSLLNQAHALWPLGRYDEAAGLYDQLAGSGAQTPSSRNVLTGVRLGQAEMELSRRHFREAAAAAGQALALLKEAKRPSPESLALANGVLGMVESYSGSPPRGRALCEESVHLATGTGDAVVARARLWLALALLAAGDAPGARDASLRAQETFTRLGRAHSEWRALAVAGKASSLAGDEPAAREYLMRAATLLAQLEQSLGAGGQGYLSRPDVQWLRSEFGVSTAPAAH
jgi:serine/threonine protein kinase